MLRFLLNIIAKSHNPLLMTNFYSKYLKNGAYNYGTSNGSLVNIYNPFV